MGSRARPTVPCLYYVPSILRARLHGYLLYRSRGWERPKRRGPTKKKKKKKKVKKVACLSTMYLYEYLLITSENPESE